MEVDGTSSPVKLTLVGHVINGNETWSSQEDLQLKNGSQCLGSNYSDPDAEGYSLAGVVALSVLTGLFCLVALVGNIAVMIVIVRDRVISKHQQNLYLLSLAASDALLVVLVVPFSLTNELLGHWPFGDVYCRIYLSVDILLCTASICNICFIGLDRFISVKYPTTYKKFRTLPRIRLAILFIWMYAAAVSSLPFVGTEIIHGHSHECFINDSSWFIILSSSLSFFLPTCIIWPVYIKIYMIGRKLELARRARYAASHGEVGETKSKSHTAKTQNDQKGSSFWRTEAAGSPGLTRVATCAVTQAPVSPVQSLRLGRGKTTSDNFDPRSSEQQVGSGLVRSTSLDCFSVGSSARGRSLSWDKRPSVKTIDYQTTWELGELLSPPVANSQKRESNRHDDIGDKSKMCSSVEDEVGLLSDNNVRIHNSIQQSPVTERRLDLAQEESPDNNNSFPVTKTSAWWEEKFNITQRRGDSFWRACCTKVCRVKTNAVPRPNIVILHPLNSKLNPMKSKHRLHSMSSIASSLKNGVHRRHSSTVSIQSTCHIPSRRERRFIFIISVITGCFMICWMPFFLTYIVYAICRNCCINKVMFKVFFWIGYLNSGINPVLYTIFNKDFRGAFARLLHVTSKPTW